LLKVAFNTIKPTKPTI